MNIGQYWEKQTGWVNQRRGRRGKRSEGMDEKEKIKGDK